jgi:hypothetical protein
MEDNEKWAEAEFGKIELGDKRRTKRLVILAKQRAEKPNGSIAESCGSKSGTKAAYRLLDNEDIEAEAIQSGHRKATVERLVGEKVILAVQDTTQLNYTSHAATQNLGYLQDLSHQGMLVHTTLAVNPHRVPYGIIQQQVWVRPKDEYQKHLRRKERVTSEKESQKWLTSLGAAAKLQGELPQSRVVSVGDSEADVYDLFWEASKLKQDVLVRACEDRRVDHPEKLLWKQVGAQEKAGEITIQVPRRAGKKARQAVLGIRYCQVRLRPPQRRYKEKLPLISLWAVLAREEAPTDGEEAIEWLLLTTVEVNSLADGCERIQWYTCRWVIEMYHKVLKSGCRVEERQFADLDNLKRYLALDAVVAWRVLYLTLLSRETPDVDCSVILEIHQWQALYCFIHKTKTPPRQPPTLKDATRWIAQLGGFLGRKSDGNPGSMTIWRGLQRLSDIADAWLVFHA